MGVEVDVVEATGVVVEGRDQDPYTILPGHSGTIGRRADIVLGNDPLLHGVVCRVEAQQDLWTVRVPRRNRLEVAAYVGSRCVWAGSGGSTWSTSARRAILQVRTAEGVHEVLVTWKPAYDGWVGEPSDTLEFERLLDIADPTHRAMIVACSDRLVDSFAPALPASRVARLLDIRVEAARRRLSRALLDVRDLMLESSDEAVAQVTLVDRDRAVDWLVATSIVGSQDLVEAIGYEAELHRERGDVERDAG